MSRVELVRTLEAMRMDDKPLHNLDAVVDALLAYVDDDEVTRLVNEVTA